MGDLRELYQEMIIDHAKSPRNFGALEDADRTVEGYNPLCGDKFTIYLRLDGDTISDIHFDGSGCAISTASASLMTEALRSKTTDEAVAFIARFHSMVTTPAERPLPESDLGKLAVLAGVREFPVRVKCATLAWHSLRAALQGNGAVVSTE